MLTQTSTPITLCAEAAPLQFSPEQVELLRRVFPGLDDDGLNDIASMACEHIASRGTILCREGEPGNTLLVIMSGRVMISQRLERDTTRTLAYRNAGDFIGEMSILFEGQTRSADVIAVETTTVLEIERVSFMRLLQANPSVVLAVLRCLVNRQQETDQHTLDDLRQKYAELGKTYRRLKDEDRRKSEFVTTVAHELRTPLTSIKGYLNLIRAGVIQREAMPFAIHTIKTNLDTIVRLVNNILLLQEIAIIAPQFQSVSLGDVLTDTIDTFKTATELPGNITLQTEIAPGLTIQADPAELKHAFGALLDNAVKFSPEGGKVVVSAHADAGKVNVQFRDPGVGIAPDVLPYIFDHFHQTDADSEHVFSGLGLGLPTVKAVVNQHNGAIRVESEPGKGSTFTVTLPM
jgi:signal transduction histidine kinase